MKKKSSKKSSAKNGINTYYQNGLDFKPKSIGQNGETIAEKRRKELVSAANTVASSQPNSEALEKLLLTTAWMENNLGANPKAWGRDYTKGPMSIDQNAYDDLFLPRGNNKKNATQNKYDEWLSGTLKLDVNKMDSLLTAGDPVAGMAAARGVYGRSPKALPDPNNPEAMFNYYREYYNKKGADKYETPEQGLKRFKEGYEFIKTLKKQQGGVIEDDMGQWAHPGKVTKINSNKITMKGVDYPVLGVSDTGEQQMMFPNNEYKFGGSSVIEYPVMQNGGNAMSKNAAKRLDDLINFTNYQKAQTGMELPQLTFRDQVLKAMANTAPGQFEKQPSMLEKLIGPPTKNKKVASAAKAAMTRTGFKNGGKAEWGIQKPLNTANPFNVEQVKLDWGSQNLTVPNQFTVAGQAQQFANTLPTSGSTTPTEGFGFADAINMGAGLLGGIGMIQDQRNQVKESKQFNKLSGLVKQASDTMPDRTKRKYARPEDMVFNPNEMSPSYGTGSNFLKSGGEIQNTYAPGTLYDNLGYEPLRESEIPKAAFGFLSNVGADQIGSAGSALGSLAGGGRGQVGAWGSMGSQIGKMIPVPGVSQAVSGVLGLAGGIVDGIQMKKIRQNTDAANMNLQQAAMSQAMQNQGSAFMEHGGWVSHDWQPQVITKFGEHKLTDLLKRDPMMDTLRTGGNLRQNFMSPEEFMQMGGQLKTHWGGDAETVSVNPYLPDSGESVLFKGQSHDDGGIGITFGNTPVEVEGGEPAVKLQDGGEGGNNLVVFGNMKIPSYGVSELNDPNAKGKKFKSYINDLNKQEAKQNKTIDRTIKFTENVNESSPFDRLKLSSAEANLIGTDMKLKDIAQKKQTASSIQNAILETAKEMGLESDALAKGKIKKAKNGAKIPKAQDSIQVKENYTIPRSKQDEYMMYGYQVDPEDPNRLYRDINSNSTITKMAEMKSPVGGTKTKDEEKYWKEVLIPMLQKGITPEQLSTKDPKTGKRYMHEAHLERAKQYYKPVSENVTKTDRDYIYLKDDGINAQVQYLENSGSTSIVPNTTTDVTGKNNTGLADAFNALMPFLRPSNQRNLDPNQLMGEMFALSNNQLEPVQAQLY